MNIETRSLMGLALLGILDVIIPFPILGAALIYVVLQKPPWFIGMVREIYEEQQ